MIDVIKQRFAKLHSAADFWSLRFVEERFESLMVRQNVPQPPSEILDCGAMLTVLTDGGCGYAATGDLSTAGLQAALDRAAEWARATAKYAVVDFRTVRMPEPRGRFATATAGAARPSRRELYDLLAEEARQAKFDDRIVDWRASLNLGQSEHLYLTNGGGEVHQQFAFMYPNVSVSANAGAATQTRSLAGEYCLQGGFEIIERSGLVGSGRRAAEQALQLVLAPNCPSGKMDLLLMPDQMMLQIHESIGHPLELDRILGDERNFAGTSFVTLDMFGHYRYGSPLLNITHDPTRVGQLASYAFDDDGSACERASIIRGGVLERPLGGLLSQLRAGLPGVANSRAESWNRPPIDRMANLNLEPGRATLNEMIAGIERGILMETNVSWSIDDSRNKFQFGCEWGRLIENGTLTTVVRNPNYRGISATFWRSLREVGDESTFEIMGTPYCGKGEPSQVIRVGHAAPACVFSQVDVFGAED
jgi:predicted Zn-dependent protease